MAVELKTGKVIWQMDLPEVYGEAPSFFGQGSCPLPHKDKLIVHVGTSQACVVALNKKTGEEIWRTASLWNGSYAAFRKMYAKQVIRGNLVLVPIGLMICLAPDMFVTILLGRQWLLAVPILAWLGGRPLMVLFAAANTWSMVAMGKAKELLFARIFSALFTLAALIAATQLTTVNFIAVLILAQAVKKVLWYAV